MSVKIIAEIGWNHMGDLSLAEEMICAAKKSGADVVKFQYWNPDYLKPGSWDSDGRREIYNKAALTEEKINSLQKLSTKYECEFLMSVFGTNGAKFMKDLGLKVIKIPSHETTNTKLIEYCSENFEYIYFSAGASTKNEVLQANEILKSGSTSFNIMHCVSSYPCESNRANIERINWLKEVHDSVGYSDHTGSTIIPAVAVGMGASVIEKHFTTDKNLPGRDNKFALDANEFELMTKNIRETELSLVDHGIDYQDIEEDTVLNYRGRWEPHDYE